ncbi:DUF4097 family beta strand repeat-containing protein [Aerococcus sanguinicola]|uniref:DUF4097 family beta strand repeat-containing protein n=2 Tax=Aerococcus TaxID=1375 RepID=UPI0008A5FDD8|nr:MULTISPECIES: DUF4097 family beta strand repeat-containing protein [unclassified Aerococcus]MDK6233294.1 DUF4097 family beta strand repeat-containing protein [Aerococcus sp. UMB10185]MDK6855122.1 DUF4097 family beta strand repeat-containing protein [Aerococcus sp. UMB7533]MDK8501962.1 DUF4097 family beta strand repeat-containing protein [Aerococcus sp. UMB1112A]OFN04460.1 hypothetical protein HMPREF2626_00270 [Aerococcus sp. HMSC062A02]OHO42963.1 hypothetical protein HMPREF2705_02390 [Aeroc
MSEDKQRILKLVQEGLLSREEALVLLEQRQAKESDSQKQKQGLSFEEAQALAEFYEDQGQDDLAQAILKNYYLDREEKLEAELDVKEAALEELGLAESADEAESKLALEEEIKGLKAELACLRDQASQSNNDSADEPVEEPKAKTDQEEKSGLGQMFKDLKTAVEGTVHFDRGRSGIPRPHLVTRQFEERFTFDEIAKDFDFSISKGDILVEVAEIDQVEVLVTGTILGKYQEESVEEAFRKRTLIENQGGCLRFELNNRLLSTNIRLRLPKVKFSQLNFRSLLGGIQLTGLEAESLDLYTIDGDIRVAECQANSGRVNTKNGLVVLDQVAFDHLDAQTANGDQRFIGEVRELAMDTLNGNLRLTVTSPDLETVNCQTTSGDVKLNVNPATSLNADLRSNNGTIRWRQESFKVETLADSRFNQAKSIYYLGETRPAQINLSSVSGDIWLKAEAKQ